MDIRLDLKKYEIDDTGVPEKIEYISPPRKPKESGQEPYDIRRYCDELNKYADELAVHEEWKKKYHQRNLERNEFYKRLNDEAHEKFIKDLLAVAGVADTPDARKLVQLASENSVGGDDGNYQRGEHIRMFKVMMEVTGLAITLVPPVQVPMEHHVSDDGLEYHFVCPECLGDNVFIKDDSDAPVERIECAFCKRMMMNPFYDKSLKRKEMKPAVKKSRRPK